MRAVVPWLRRLKRAWKMRMMMMLEVALFVLAVDFVVELDDVVALLLPLPRVLSRR